MRKEISKFLKYSVLRRPKSKEKRWLKEKNEILGKASISFPYDISLDVSKRHGVYIFHDKGNTLIKRGNIYEPETKSAIMALLFMDKMRNESTYFADIGANIGLHTFYIRSKYPDLNIIAFDPSPMSWKYMEFSIDFNSIKGVNLHKVALSDSNGFVDFYNWGSESSADSLVDTKRVDNKKPNILKVESKRLDDFQDPPPSITVLKIDCEGAEIKIFQGAQETIKKCRPFILSEFNKTNMEAFNLNAIDVINFSEKQNYSIFSLQFQLLNPETFTGMQNSGEENFILLPDEFINNEVFNFIR